MFPSFLAHFSFTFCSVPHLKTVVQLLENMESCQLSSLSQAHLSQGVWPLSLLDMPMFVPVHVYTRIHYEAHESHSTLGWILMSVRVVCAQPIISNYFWNVLKAGVFSCFSFFEFHFSHVKPSWSWLRKILICYFCQPIQSCI